MTIKHKTFLFQEEDQYQNSYQNTDLLSHSQKLTSKISSFAKKLNECDFNICTIILLAFLIAAGGVTAYRYVELINISKDLLLNNSATMKHYEDSNDKNIIQSSLNFVKLNEQKEILHHDKLKQPVETSSFISNQIEYPKNQQKKFQIISQQSKKLIPLYPQQSKQKQNSDILTNQQDSPLPIPSSSDIKQSSKISEVNENRNTQYNQKQLYDPIMRVRQKIGKNLGVKFEDSPFIKKGTHITEDQYSKAKDRMQLWRYFNVRTKSFQFLPQGLLANQQNLDIQFLQKMQAIDQEEQEEIEKKYQASQYEEIPFCIIIPSFKNGDKYFRNLNSIFQQSYSKFHVIYIDDASQDNTAENVLSYIKKYEIPSHKLKFIENKQNKKALPNIDFAARNLCNSGEIMAIIDGDDYLIGRQVFSMINAQYQKEGLLALYTNHLRVHEPIYLKVGTCMDYPIKVKKARSYRHVKIFPASHLRTFYVDLYWRIKKRDLQDTRGQYFHAANDFAIMMPILEMAGEKVKYLPELTYVYDAGTGFNNFQTKTQTQARNFKTTKRRLKYPKLDNLDFVKYSQNSVHTQV